MFSGPLKAPLAGQQYIYKAFFCAECCWKETCFLHLHKTIFTVHILIVEVSGDSAVQKAVLQLQDL